MEQGVMWSDETAEYVKTRSARYPGAQNLRPEWVLEIVADIDFVMIDPDPKSRVGAVRLIGWSDSARRLLTAIVYRDFDGDFHLINMWPASGHDVRLYETGRF